jgi:hypothetical protein
LASSTVIYPIFKPLPPLRHALHAYIQVSNASSY